MEDSERNGSRINDMEGQVRRVLYEADSVLDDITLWKARFQS